ncbi:unnamed protein product [Menidia menidia]|uniref:(Atlantic silverside) hypothetical protein n=1 Tax=Menidia menidia TaxID=238744 RepID=A0A8S4AUR1_9TELE|nr:unnamed protein product [Menidia menidia]
MRAREFRGSDNCGGNIKIDAPDYLTSPGYPATYPPSQQCAWVITAPEAGQKILINFNPHFDLEDRECKLELELSVWRLGSSRVAFGNESNARNMPVEGGLKPFLARPPPHLQISRDGVLKEALKAD